MSVPIKGTAALRRELEGLKEAYPNATAAAVHQEALELLADSLLQVPVDTGTLRRSGYAEPPHDVRNPVAVVGYGTDYALPVHERMEAQHPVGNAKFLERPFLARQQNFVQRMIDRIRRNVEKKVRLG